MYCIDYVIHCVSVCTDVSILKAYTCTLVGNNPLGHCLFRLYYHLPGPQIVLSLSSWQVTVVFGRVEQNIIDNYVFTALLMIMYCGFTTIFFTSGLQAPACIHHCSRAATVNSEKLLEDDLRS